MPYPAGDPTNIVHTRPGTSNRLINWFLVCAQSPITACSKVLLPGLSTYRVLVCEFTVRTKYLALANPSGRRFRFKGAYAGSQPRLLVGQLHSPQPGPRVLALLG